LICGSVAACIISTLSAASLSVIDDTRRTDEGPQHNQMMMSLESYLEENRIWHRFIEKQETVHTVDASQATGIDLHRITKNLVSVTDTGEHVVLIVPGDRRVNLKEAARALGVKNVRLMPFDQSGPISGYPPGGTPSLGYKTVLRVVLDEELGKFDTFYCGGGSRDRLLEVKTADVIRLNKAIVKPITS
jgi:Cys-tRNA(Pro)/Cys-tRNA(Cys) deacylase